MPLIEPLMLLIGQRRQLNALRPQLHKPLRPLKSPIVSHSKACASNRRRRFYRLELPGNSGSCS